MLAKLFIFQLFVLTILVLKPKYSGQGGSMTTNVESWAPPQNKHDKDVFPGIGTSIIVRPRVLASPKFLPTDSDLFSSQIRRTDRPRQNKVIIYIYI